MFSYIFILSMLIFSIFMLFLSFNFFPTNRNRPLSN
nr:MAG TPA: hypothetical protein [Caudoviricetes sp.]